MSIRPYKRGKALSNALLLWAVGFIWGVTVFTLPWSKNIPSVQYVSKYPAISIPLTVIYLVMSYFLTKAYVSATNRKAEEGLKLGVTVVLVNLLLDILVYVVLLGSTDYFGYFSIWLSYTILFVVPWLVGRTLQD